MAKHDVETAEQDFVVRYPDLKPLNVDDLGAPGFDHLGHSKRGMNYPDIISLIMREDPEVFQRKLDMIVAGDYSVVKTQKEILARLTISRAQQGDQKAMEWLADREEGKVTQSFILAKEDNQLYLAQLRSAVALGEGVKKDVST